MRSGPVHRFPLVRGKVVIKCQCGAAEHLNPGKLDINDEAVVNKLARNRGWELNPRQPDKSTCPACVKETAPVKKPTLTVIEDRPTKEPTFTVTEKPDPALVKAVEAEPNSRNVQPRALTVQERMAIVSKLHDTFDPVRGAYEPGYSDQKVSAELSVPRAHVTTIRDAAFGPIRLDHAEEERKLLRRAIAALDTKVGLAESEALNAAERVEAAIASAEAVRKELDELKAKLEKMT